MEGQKMNNPLTESILVNFVLKGEWEIDSQGRIWNKKTGRRAEHVVPHGYLQVRKMMRGKRLCVGAHRLVWRYFKGPIPPGLTINHRNGEKADNRPENLELATYSEQAVHAHRVLGKGQQWGQANPMAKLTNDQVVAIRNLYAGGKLRQHEIATKFGITIQTVSAIVRGKVYPKQGGRTGDFTRLRQRTVLARNTKGQFLGL
jgi:DNA-binding XRE family transcriptional regulator